MREGSNFFTLMHWLSVQEHLEVVKYLVTFATIQGALALCKQPKRQLKRGIKVRKLRKLLTADIAKQPTFKLK